MNKLVSGALGVEIKLPSSGTKIYFPDLINLRRKRIKHIDFCSYSELSLAPSGRSIAILKNELSLTFMEVNTQKELIQNLPVINLSQNGNRLFINKIIDFQRSYITLMNPGDMTDKSLFFVIWYDEPTVWNVVNSNPRSIIEPFEIQLAGAKTYFKEHLSIRNKQIENILLSFPTYSPTGYQGIDQASIDGKFITLTKHNFEFFKQVPLYLFYQPFLYQPLRLQNITIDFERSYIETVGIAASDLKTVFFNAIIDDNHSQR